MMFLQYVRKEAGQAKAENELMIKKAEYLQEKLLEPSKETVTEFLERYGEPYRPKSFTRKWAKTLEKYGLRHIKLHGTRHSAISLLLSEGVPIQIVQQRAGHQDPKITLAVYSHVSKDKESLVADTLGEILFVWHENLQADK